MQLRQRKNVVKLNPSVFAVIYIYIYSYNVQRVGGGDMISYDSEATTITSVGLTQLHPNTENEVNK